MQTFVRDQLAAEPVRLPENSRSPADFCRSVKIRNTGNKQSPAIAKTAVHHVSTHPKHSLEQIMNIVHCQGDHSPAQSQMPGALPNLA
jgi:hypothetical protein